MTADLFDELLSLEDQFYHDGYRSGFSDGKQTGLAEGRAFGLEKGFEKYRAMGRLGGRSLVWASRLDGSQPKDIREADVQEYKAKRVLESRTHHSGQSLPDLPSNFRLPKHISVLLSITDPSKVSTANTEEAVDIFEDKFKRAERRIQMVEKIIGKRSPSEGMESLENAGGRDAVQGKYKDEEDIEDIKTLGLKV